MQSRCGIVAAGYLLIGYKLLSRRGAAFVGRGVCCVTNPPSLSPLPLPRFLVRRFRFATRRLCIVENCRKGSASNSRACMHACDFCNISSPSAPSWSRDAEAGAGAGAGVGLFFRVLSFLIFSRGCLVVSMKYGSRCSGPAITYP